MQIKTVQNKTAKKSVPIRASQVAFFLALIASINLSMAAAAEQTRPRRTRLAPPIRDPHAPGYVSAQELPDGTILRPDVDGNFIIGPMHKRAAEMTVHDGVPKGDGA